jgi:hypothetical protein
MEILLFTCQFEQVAEQLTSFRLLKNAQMQGPRNPKE